MSIKDLSDYFSVSERSIRYYVNNLNYERKEHGFQLIKKSVHCRTVPMLKAFFTGKAPTAVQWRYQKEIHAVHSVL